MTEWIRHEHLNRLVKPGLAANTSTNALVCQDVYWELKPARTREIPLVEMEKDSLYHANCP